jgi:RNA polymerase sigma-70 factor (ECF subfamily)
VDTQQIRDLYASSYRRLVVQLYAMTCDLGEAQDVVQEAFAKALAAPRQFAFKSNPEAWLRTVAVNLMRSRWRRQPSHSTTSPTCRSLTWPRPSACPSAP